MGILPKSKTRYVTKLDSVGERGRTLTEMLGILILIGVLSAAGMGLYAKAMNTLRANHVMDQVLLRHVELANEERAINSHKTFDVARGSSEAKLAYGYAFGDCSVASCSVTGAFSKGVCRILQKRVEWDEETERIVNYKDLQDIQISGKSIKDGCPDGKIGEITFTFDNAVAGGPRQYIPDVIPPDPVDPEVVCPVAEDKPATYGASCIYIAGENCCGGVFVCVHDEESEDPIAGTCHCPMGTTLCRGNCYLECNNKKPRDAECNCEEDVLVCPAEADKPTTYRATCIYIASENCCGGDFVCVQNGAKSGTCQCPPGKEVCQGQCYDPCDKVGQTGDRDEDCNCVEDVLACPAEADKPTTYGASCTYIAGENCCGGDFVCVQDEESEDPTAGKCRCPSGKEACQGQCYDPCDKAGQTGDRDTDCRCKCIGGANPDTCQCDPGYVFRNGKCVGTYCIEQYGDYTCYLEGVRCGQNCTSTKITKEQGGKMETCEGYCDNFCPYNSTWGKTSIHHSGLGCQATWGDKLYCGTNRSFNDPRWFCKRKDAVNSPVCCQAYEFGVCYWGVCNPNVCKDVKNSDKTSSEYVEIAEDDLWGCKVVRNGQTAYCMPSGDYWKCYRSKLTGGGYAPHCGWGSLQDLNSGSYTFSECFAQNPSCLFPAWSATWVSQDQRCKGTFNGATYECDFGGNCYAQSGSGWEQCGMGCRAREDTTIAPRNCLWGICNTKFCTSGKLGKMDEDRYGCITERNGDMYAFVQEGDTNTCYYKKKGEKNFEVCAYNCGSSHDCVNCQQPLLPVCAPKGQCLQNGMEINGCTCLGTASGGHCCVSGHSYVNGKCSLVNVKKGKCIYGSYDIDETEDYGAIQSALCECKDTTKCMDQSGVRPVCGECPKEDEEDEEVSDT